MDAAYFDRIGDEDTAILLVQKLQKNFLIPLSKLPPGSKPGDWFQVDILHNEIRTIQRDEKQTKKMESDIQNQLNHLQSKKRSQFKRR